MLSRRTILVGLVVMTGCVPRAPTSAPTNAVATDAPLPTVTPVDFTSSPTPKDTAIARRVCPIHELESAPEFYESGVVVFANMTGQMLGTDSDLYSLSVPEMTLQPFLADLSRGIFTDFRVSPEGKWLAFVHEKLDGQHMLGHDLILATSHPEDRKSVPWDEKSWAYDLNGWTTDGKGLLITPRFSDDMRPPERPDAIIILDPFTGRQQRMSLLFPNAGSFYPDYWKQVGMSAVYAPTLNHVAYLEDGQAVVLWDIKNLREVWRFTDSQLAEIEVPTWSPDGQILTLVELDPKGAVLSQRSSFRFLFISVNGEVSRSTALPYFAGLNPHVGWSPDSRYLYLVWTAGDNEPVTLLLWDTVAQEFIDYCLDDVTGPVWSPDSRQFVVRAAVPSESSGGQGGYQDLLVYVEQGRVLELNTTPLDPVAWLRGTP